MALPSFLPSTERSLPPPEAPVVLGNAARETPPDPAPEPAAADRRPEKTPVSEAQPETAAQIDGEQSEKRQADQPPDGKDNFLDEAINRLRQSLRGRKNKPTAIPAVRDELTVQIENIMEAGLADAYRVLTPVQQQEFKIKGEQTAWEIRALLKQAHVKIKKIFKLLVSWLRILPGVNRLFLEQEAKIKADQIMALKRKSKN